MKDGKWSDKTGDLIINSYQETLEVTDEELKIMKYFIMFPQSFWQIGLQYYWEQQPWNEEVFINKIIRYLEDVEYREIFLDEYLSNHSGKIDYIHGDDTTINMGMQEGNVGILFEAMPKSELFKTVILDGALPRKTFSMGHSYDKRFYLEARKIK